MRESSPLSICRERGKLREDNACAIPNLEAGVLVDGGVRRGRDVVKALALGAEAAMTGRATLDGACAGGEAGAAWALEILRDELIRTMRLCGVCAVSEIGPDLVAPSNEGAAA